MDIHGIHGIHDLKGSGWIAAVSAIMWCRVFLSIEIVFAFLDLTCTFHNAYLEDA